MTATLLPLAWAGLVVGWMARSRPAARGRTRALVDGPDRVSPLVTAARNAVARALPSTRRLATVLLVAVAFGALFPPLGLVVLVGAIVRPLLAERRLQAARASAVERDIADVFALIGLAVSAGCNLPGALATASQHGEGPLSLALRSTMAGVRRGARLADALEQLPAVLGESVRPLSAALVSCDRYGAALGPTLDRLAVDVRTASRQRAEAAARRLPVRLLFPLVTCILPAFGLLTVAPLIAGSLRGLRL